ncbi:hypothetical protein L2E82_30601 [Cichorium intybus]|uniref:Uncharacterized protein n=1 Tax=Cichorium intybus TaxID=13427 RepID=A0ACB9D0T8_CICIN|nr:hypothetical protein L2E82_30601 [Cichorium intybus]
MDLRKEYAEMFKHSVEGSNSVVFRQKGASMVGGGEGPSPGAGEGYVYKINFITIKAGYSLLVKPISQGFIVSFDFRDHKKEYDGKRRASN